MWIQPAFWTYAEAALIFAAGIGTIWCGFLVASGADDETSHAEGRTWRTYVMLAAGVACVVVGFYTMVAGWEFPANNLKHTFVSSSPTP